MAETKDEIQQYIEDNFFNNGQRFITGNITQEGLLKLLNYTDLDTVQALITASNAGASLLFANETERDAYAAPLKVGDKCYVVGNASLYTWNGTSWDLSATLEQLQGTRVVLKQEPLSVASANNFPLTASQYYIIADNSNNIQLIDSEGITGGTMLALECQAGLTIEHNNTASGYFKPIILATDDDFTFSSSRILLFIYDEKNELWKEVGRTTVGEATQFVAALAQGYCINVASSIDIIGFPTSLAGYTVTNMGTSSVSIINDAYVQVGSGTAYGIIISDGSGNKVYEVDLTHGFVSDQCTEIENGNILLTEGSYTTGDQDKYFPWVYNGGTLVENADNTGQYVFVPYKNNKTKI